MPKDEQYNLSEYEQRIRECLIIDETSPSGLRWNQNAISKVKSKAAGTIEGGGYWSINVHINKVRKSFKAHRIIWFLANGHWPKEQIDHINRNRADNRLSNLREASCEENNRNTGKRKDNSSGVKGVSFHKKTGKWLARLGNGGKRIYLGVFSEQGDAELAVMAARVRHHEGFVNHGKN